MNRVSVSNLKSLIAVSLGNVIEWYEYSLFAYFSIRISEAFFPHSNGSIGPLLHTAGIFGIGLVVRPIGGIILGHFADKYSRKAILSVTILSMSLSTIAMGLLPTYQAIGWLAPMSLLILRIIQGMALGGEFGISCVYIYESAEEGQRGFLGSMILAGFGVGLILSICTTFLIESLLTTFSSEFLSDNIWRLPFLISFLGTILAFYMRRTILETKEFTQIKAANLFATNPLMEMFREHKRTLFNLLAIFITTKTTFYLVLFHSKSMMMSNINFNESAATRYNLYSIISYTIFTIITGYLSDMASKWRIIFWSVLGICCTSYPFIVAIKSGSPEGILLMSILIGIFIAMAETSLNPIAVESFPTNIRTTSVAFCWNFAAGVFGGIAPYLALWLADKYGSIATAYYLMAVCAITLSALVFNNVTKLTRGGEKVFKIT